MNSSNKSILIPSLSIWAVLAFGTFFPDELWGGHFLAFYSTPVKLLLLGVSLFLILRGGTLVQKLTISSLIQKKNWSLYLSIGFGVLFYFIPITFDYYGDAPYFMEGLNKIESLDNGNLIKHLFDFKVWNPKIGEKTVLCFVQLIANSIKFDFVFAFKVLGSLCAGLFLFNWINLIRISVTGRTSQILLLLLGLSSPMLQIFQGHQEIYGPVLVSFVFFFVRLKKYHNSANKQNLAWLIIALVLCLKMHITSVILIPTLVITFFQNQGKLLSLKSVFMGLFIPFSILGLLAYFFILEDYNDPRFLTKNTSIEERIFLPILSPEAPLDRYTLFHLNHLKDFLNQSLIWSPLLFIVLAGIVYFRKQVNWRNPTIIQSVFLSTCYISVYFLINPLLGMQLDWDLFSIPGIVILCTVVFIWGEVDQHTDSSKYVAPILGIGLFIIPTLGLNTNDHLIGQRLLSIGRNTFKGYWIGSIATLKNGIKALNKEKDPNISINNLEKAGKDLEEYALKGKDIEFSAIYSELGILYTKYKKDHNQAKIYHEKAAEYSLENGDNLIALMENLFFQKEFKKASIVAESLVQFQYPTQQKALTIAIHIALEAGQSQKALSHCKTYFKINPNNALINHLIHELNQGTDPKLLAQNFKRKR